MRLISWNVNGLRSCLGKGFLDFCAFADADIICLQETKMRPEQAQFDLPGYRMFWNSADKAGYSGGSSPPSLRTSGWYAATPPTPRISWRGWTTAWNGRTTSANTSWSWTR